MPSLVLRPPPVQMLAHPLLSDKGVQLAVLRLDLIHPAVQGNKWFKLKHNLAAVREAGVTRVLSFGGAFSNHLYALAAAGEALGLETIGAVRGEIIEPLNPVLRSARTRGMHLCAVSRARYRLLRELPEELLFSNALDALDIHSEARQFIDDLRRRFGEFAVIPEGGGNRLAALGCEEIADYCDWGVFDAIEHCDLPKKRVVALCCGTATTMAGVVNGFAARAVPSERSPFVQGISVLRSKGYLHEELNAKLSSAGGACNWDIDERFDFGGYAKRPLRLRGFTNRFKRATGIPIEPVYTGKLFYALWRRIARDEYPVGTQIIAVHTGGIV